MTRLLMMLVIHVGAMFTAALDGQQARDTTPTPGVATARIAGQVLLGGTDAQPLRRVIVTITGEGMKVGRTTVTDDQGRFAFDALPAGRFLLTGTKPAYLAGAYGASQPGRPGVPIQLAAGEVRNDVSFAMVKGAAITGMVRTEGGEPAANVDVTVFKLPAPGSDPRLVISGVALSDDRGVYRIYDLAPGSYVVAGALRRRALGTGDSPAWSVAQITEMLRQLEERDKRNTASTVTPPPAPVATYTYAPVFFPGSSTPDLATPIRLRASEDRNGIDFTVQLTRMAAIEGLLVGAEAAGASFFFNPAGVQLPSLMGSTPTFSSATVAAGRAFKYSGVTPGRYTITAQVRDGTAWARTEVVVAGDDVSGVTMALQPSLRMSGHAVFQATRLTPPDNLATLNVRLTADNQLGQSSSGGTRMGNPTIPSAVVQPDGRFEISGLVPDIYRLTATVPGNAGWWLKSAIVEGRDLLDTLVNVTTDITNAVLTFSDQRASLGGRLLTSGPPAAPYFIVAFPVDRSLWVPQGRRILSTRADTSGAWILRDLPPGDYLVAALTDLGPEELADATFLEQLVPSAIKVRLGDGENKIQDLRIGG